MRLGQRAFNLALHVDAAPRGTLLSTKILARCGDASRYHILFLFLSFAFRPLVNLRSTMIHDLAIVLQQAGLSLLPPPKFRGDLSPSL